MARGQETSGVHKVGQTRFTLRFVTQTQHLRSGDGSLSVLDVRSKRTDPFAQSEDQEDELLSVVSIKG